MSKARSHPILAAYVLVPIILFGAILMTWIWTTEFMEARSYKEKGLPASAIALELRGVRNAYKAGNYYRYLMELNGRCLESEFERRLELGKRYDVLISATDPDKFVLGSPQDWTLSIYANKSGCGFLGWATTLMLPLMVIAGVVLTVQTIVARRRRGRGAYLFPPFK
jgi:hypothetical protein